MEQQLQQSKTREAAQQDTGDPELQASFNDLENRHERLQVELHEQEQVTEEVRQQATQFLDEMRALSEQSQSNWDREEQLSKDVHRLHREVEQWKSRYAKAKAQLRQLRTSSVGIADFRPDAGSVAKEDEFLQQDGMVKDIHVTRFQMSIDDLLRTARSDEPSLVMLQVTVAILIVRRILQDVNVPQDDDSTAAVLAKVRNRVTATANNLITASKNFANSEGISPVSLLDAAASHLCAAVVELVRLVKIRPTPADELDEDDNDGISQLQSPDYFDVAPNPDRFSSNESVYSAISTPSTDPNITSHFPLPPKGLPNGGTMDRKPSLAEQPMDRQ